MSKAFSLAAETEEPGSTAKRTAKIAQAAIKGPFRRLK
jgi:hypothetical protein